MDDITISKLFIVGLVIYATSLHEMAHAYVAFWLGDPTPGRHGRLTWNPVPHLDPPLTAVFMPLVLYMTSGTLIGMAQTPIDPSRFRRPLRDHALVALAGPMANFLFMGVLIGILWIPGIYKFTLSNDPYNYAAAILPMAAFWNLVLGVFNLFPIPPLDGYRIARAFMPLGVRRKMDEFAAMGSMSMGLVLLAGWFILPQYINHLYRFFIALLPAKTYVIQ
ncbi:MAG TPA: site-2 protease family protein [Planctomycetota bacterium]|nr:site-2 protease family protein [Planctomycetota bacterium]